MLVLVHIVRGLCASHELFFCGLRKTKTIRVGSSDRTHHHHFYVELWQRGRPGVQRRTGHTPHMHSQV